MSEHALTTNHMGYFWCSCNPHRAHVMWSLNEHLAEIAAQVDRLQLLADARLELLRLVVAYDDANQSDLPLPLLDGIRLEVRASR